MPSIPLPWLILLAIAAALAARVVLAIGRALALRGKITIALKQAGQQALAKVPDSIKLERVAGSPDWKQPLRMEELAKPLLAAGFADCGVYAVDRMPGVKVWFLMNEQTSTAAFLYEHPQAKPWVEFSVRYESGETCALSTLPPTGLQHAPFFHRIQADGIVPTDRLYARLLAERPQDGIKRVTRDTVVREYEEAYLKIMLWQKNKGLSIAEVAAVAKKKLDERYDSRG